MPEQVEHLALHPVRRLPDAGDGGAGLAVRDADLQADPLVAAVEGVEPGDDVEARLALLPVDRRQVDEVGERLVVLQVAAGLDELVRRDLHGRLADELLRAEDGAGHGRGEGGDERLADRVVGGRAGPFGGAAGFGAAAAGRLPPARRPPAPRQRAWPVPRPAGPVRRREARRGVLRSSVIGELLGSAPEDAHLLDLLLELHEAVEERLGPRRAAGDVDVDRDEPVDALRHRVGPVRAAARRAGAHRDDPLRVGHLVVEALDDRRHLLGDRPGDEHQVGLARRAAEDLGAEARHVVAAVDDGHHLDRAAGEAELERPERVLAAPADQGVDRGREDVVRERVLDQAHESAPLFQA